MHLTSLWLKILNVSKVSILFIFFQFFSSSCSYSKKIPEFPQKTLEQETQISLFLTDLLFRQGGVYTLFGDKPMTSLLLFTGSLKEIDLSVVSEEARNSAIYCEVASYEDWLAWKKFIFRDQLENFIFAEHPCPLDPSQRYLLFVNKKEMRKVLQIYKENFIKSWGEEFSIDWAIEELTKEGSRFWNNVLTDHFLAGIAYGYGLENVLRFTDNLRAFKEEGKASDEFLKHPSPREFSLPIFKIYENKQVIEKYKIQKESILYKYRDRPFLEVTMERLRQKR